mmetsp:Transcript_7597/g.10480  ORF Transcript_7597/g.10480 Transcript_7597/m.10480 type:complete len:336 (+) Transcript_7597:34-1041(+)
MDSALLTSVKLKPTQIKVQAHKPASVSDEINIEEWYAANIENWYQDIAEFTFKTVFIPLTKHEANALCNIWEINNTKNTDKSQMDTNTLKELETKIDEALKGFPKGAFAKLSCRSPKDATVNSPEMKQIYLDLVQKEGQPVDENTRLKFLYLAHLRALKVSSGHEAVNLFAKSGRIYQDLQLALSNPQSTSEDTIGIQVILREWIDVDIAYEFRGFVHSRKLHALSQYYDMIHFPQLQVEKDSICTAIHNFFGELASKIPLEHYIIDFALLKQSGTWTVIIIELNPFSSNTDAGLFSWSKDYAVLTQGPFECRVLEKPYKNLATMVFDCWKEYLC